MPKIHLVIPDSHAHPDHSNERYSYLSRLIAELNPDTVIDIGDWFDMASLCSYDRGTRGFHGRRYQADIAAGVEAQDRLLSPLRKRKKRLPRFVRCLGNHEHRIIRAIDREPELLEGTIGLSDLQSKEYRWEEVPFLQPINIDGVNYAHYFVSGVMGRPVSSARALLNHQNATCIQGHAHTFDYATKANIQGDRFHGIFCGVFQDYTPEFASATDYMWRPGVLILHNVEDGDFDMEWVSMKRLKELYGS
jgi:hypothetical protein